MPDYLPRRLGEDPNNGRKPRFLQRAEDRTELAVYLHGLEASRISQCDQIDSMALADAITTSTEEELRFIDHGRRLAGDDPAKLAVVASKAEILTNLDNRRIVRRFGP
jgi:hypothetical protein